LGTPIKTSPVVTENLFLVHDYAANLWSFAGSEKWSVFRKPAPRDRNL
jgi:hypothetical protein